MTEQKFDQKFTGVLKTLADFLIGMGASLLSLLKINTEKTREQVRSIVFTTSDHVLEKAEETRVGVKLRMGIMEMEHHLNRLYPQIGKITCDMAAQSTRKNPLSDPVLKAKIELAEEYRARVLELKEQLALHQGAVRDKKTAAQEQAKPPKAAQEQAKPPKAAQADKKPDVQD